MWEYTDTVREHFLHPRNAGELADANAIGEVGSLACGDALKLFLKISKNGVIEDASFQTFGCASAIASSSALTELIKGKTVDEVIKITNKDIAAYLGGLPREKMHCSVMGQEALEAALRNWRGEKALPHAPEGRLICKCFGVTDTQIRRAIQENSLKSVEEITNYTKAGGGCGDCL
ncbi:MAG: Fe-S cluster assembly protein NifU, partial [Bilophila sp.]